MLDEILKALFTAVFRVTVLGILSVIAYYVYMSYYYTHGVLSIIAGTYTP